MMPKQKARGTLVLLTGDATQEEIRAAVRLLLNLPDDYDFDAEDEEDDDEEAESRHSAL
jgi:hypothetical protein